MEGIEVRWGCEEDMGAVGDILDFDSSSRDQVFDERFIVATDGLRVLAAVRVRATLSRMDLWGFVCDPRVKEGEVAYELYRGTWGLALELGIPVVWADDERHREGLLAAGYRRRIGGWRHAGEPSHAPLFGRLGI